MHRRNIFTLAVLLMLGGASSAVTFGRHADQTLPATRSPTTWIGTSTTPSSGPGSSMIRVTSGRCPRA